MIFLTWFSAGFSSPSSCSFLKILTVISFIQTKYTLQNHDFEKELYPDRTIPLKKQDSILDKLFKDGYLNNEQFSLCLV